MNERNGSKKKFTAYEYKEVLVESGEVSFYLDCYENFGWSQDEHFPLSGRPGRTVLRLKRDRKRVNKMELTRLQRQFEACAEEIKSLKKARTSAPTMWALTIGLIGTAFLAGSTFAVTARPPIIWLCVLLAVPGFLGWILPNFIYQKMLVRQKKKLEPLIEEKFDEIYQVCQKGHSLL